LKKKLNEPSSTQNIGNILNSPRDKTQVNTSLDKSHEDIKINSVQNSPPPQPNNNLPQITPKPEQVLLLIYVPSLTITKLLKVYMEETTSEMISKLIRKPGVTLDNNTIYTCWLSRPLEEPILMDHNQNIRIYNLRNHDPILLLRQGEKPDHFPISTFHTPETKRKKEENKTFQEEKEELNNNIIVDKM